MNDPLSEVLLISGMRSALISRARLGPPFGVRASAAKAIFHLVARGEAWRFGLGDDAPAEVVRAQGAVVISALVGYLLATDYFGLGDA